jgi:ribosomal protein L32
MMTTEFEIQSPGPEQVDGDAPINVCDSCGHTRNVCDSCGHTRLSHDAVATRFCQASRDGAVDRDCICPIDPSTGETERVHRSSGARRSGAPMYGRGRFSGR